MHAHRHLAARARSAVSDGGRAMAGQQTADSNRGLARAERKTLPGVPAGLQPPLAAGALNPNPNPALSPNPGATPRHYSHPNQHIRIPCCMRLCAHHGETVA